MPLEAKAGVITGRTSGIGLATAEVFVAEGSGLNASEIVVDGGRAGALAGSPRYMRGEP